MVLPLAKLEVYGDCDGTMPQVKKFGRPARYCELMSRLLLRK